MQSREQQGLHEHSATELQRDIQKVGYYEAVLNCGGEPVVRSMRDEVKRLHIVATVLNIPFAVGGSRANKAA